MNISIARWINFCAKGAYLVRFRTPSVGKLNPKLDQNANFEHILWLQKLEFFKTRYMPFRYFKGIVVAKISAQSDD